MLDDCWSDGRDKKGKLISDNKKFPRGMAAVADDLHAQGFLFGMYSSAGELTCARYGEFLQFPMTIVSVCLNFQDGLTSDSWFIGS